MIAVSSPPGRLFVGMDQQNAKRLLRGTGAKETKIDAAAPSSGGHRGAVYELHNGNLLIVDYDRKPRTTSYRVSGLRLCKNPDVPKVKRVWQDVAELAP